VFCQHSVYRDLHGDITEVPVSVPQRECQNGRIAVVTDVQWRLLVSWQTWLLLAIRLSGTSDMHFLSAESLVRNQNLLQTDCLLRESCSADEGRTLSLRKRQKVLWRFACEQTLRVIGNYTTSIWWCWVPRIWCCKRYESPTGLRVQS
jgi:hypothetical protein